MQLSAGIFTSVVPFGSISTVLWQPSFAALHRDRRTRPTSSGSAPRCSRRCAVWLPSRVPIIRLPVALVIVLIGGCAGASSSGDGARESDTTTSPEPSEPAEGLTDEERLEMACCAGLFTGEAPSAEVREACARLEALGPLPRSVDDAPHVSEASPPLPDGEVQAIFWLNTGGDQMQCRRVAVGLGVTVRFGDREYSQQLASCEDAGHGNAIASAGALDSAACDGRFFDLLRLDDAVVVREGENDIVRIPTVVTE